MNICYPKYESLCSDTKKILDVIAILSNSELFSKNAELMPQKREIDEIIKVYREIYDASFRLKFAPSLDYNQSVSAEDNTKFSEDYNELKKSSLIDFCLHICNILIPFKRSIADINNISANFIYYASDDYNAI